MRSVLVANSVNSTELSIISTLTHPSYWLESNLIKELHQPPNSGSAQKVVSVINGGKSPGTFAHELLSIEYAGWISPYYSGVRGFIS
ncbi:KilA-N domain-containing protein [Salmonella enterica]